MTIHNRKSYLYPSVDIACHQISRRQVDQLVASIAKNPNSRMLQVAIHNTPDGNALTETTLPGHQTAHPSDDKLDCYPRIIRLVELFNHFLIRKTIHL